MYKHRMLPHVEYYQTDGQAVNGHGWSDGPTDPCTGGKRVFQALNGRTDEQPENIIMPPAPKGVGIKMKQNTHKT